MALFTWLSRRVPGPVPSTVDYIPLAQLNEPRSHPHPITKRSGLPAFPVNALLAAVLVCVVAAWSLHASRTRISSFPATSSSPALCNWEAREYDEGEWKMRADGPFETARDLKAAYQLNAEQELRCYPNTNDPTLTPAHLDRILKTASYTWGTHSGCQLAPWSREKFVLHLLHAYAGLWLIGDSLTGQHFDVLVSLLAWDNGPIFRQGDTLRLNGDHSAGSLLLSLAEVPVSRLERPLVSYVRHDRILDDVELQSCILRAGVQGYAQMDPRDAKGDWYSPLSSQTYDHRVSNSSSDTLRDTIVIMNTGAHWSRQMMNLTTTHELVSAFRACSEDIVSKTLSLKKIMVYFRTTNPGHTRCERMTAPDSSLSTYNASPTENGVNSGKEYDWDLFPKLNEVWSSLVHAEEPRLALLDAWKLSNQRPDAHLRPPQDCLHHCLPTIPLEWTKLLYHHIYTQNQLKL